MFDSNLDEVAPLIFHPSRIPIKPDTRTKLERRLAIWLILLAVGFERLAFYSLAGNLVLFLTSDAIRWTSLHSVTASLFFFGSSYISALFFSWISDAKLGRAKTILVGFVLYISGYIFIPLFSKPNIFIGLCGEEPRHKEESNPYHAEICNIQITAALIVTAIGVGAVQANMAIFGAEQIQEQKGTTQYFNKYYVAVNIGGLLAFGVIAYVQQNVDWFTGHIISTALLIVTCIFFLIGYRYYIHIKPHDSVITNLFPVFINAFQTWRKHRRYTRGIPYHRRSSNKIKLLEGQDRENDHSPFEINERLITFLDYAKATNHGRYHDRVVDDIKSLGRIILMLLLLIPYWLIYLQCDTTFILQGVHMKVPLFKPNEHHMPIVWLSLTDQIIIIVIIFILNTFVYKHFHAINRPYAMKIRIVIGMVSATLSMCATGIIEIFRQQRCDLPFQNYNQTFGNTVYTAADMSVFYQLPQYIFIGLSEVFASVASLEFAYLAAPHSAQSLVMSLHFSSTGLSSFLGSGYVNIYESIYKNFTMTNFECKDNGKPELFYIYFFVLAGIQFIFIFIFLSCDGKFQILKASQHRFNTRLFIGPPNKTSNTR